MATFYKRGSRWRATVRKKGYPAKSKTFTTKAQAQKWAAQLEIDIENGVAQKDTPSGLSMTVSELCDLHMKHMTKNGTDLTRSKTLPSNARLVSAALGDHLLSELDYNLLKQYCETRIRVDGVTPATMKHLMIFLSSAVNTGVFEAEVPESLLAKMRSWISMLSRAGLVAAPKSRDRRVSDDELKAIFNHLEHNLAIVHTDYRAVIEFAIASCMRLGEIVRIRWEDYDRDKGVIIIRDRKHPTLKKGNHQVVPLLTEARAIIERQPRRDDRIFPYKSDTITTGFGRTVRRLGINDLKFHDLRHEGISRLFEKGMEIQEVAMISGHKDWSSLRRYTNLKPENISAKWSD